MATTLITRETAGGGATVKNAPLTNPEVDLNFISLANNKVEIIDGTVAVIPTGTTGERPSSPEAGYLRFNETENVFEGYDGVEWGSIAGGGGVSYTFHTANYTTSAGEGVLADTTGGSFTVTLPASPSVGDTVVIADAGGAWGTNNLTIARNGETIEDAADDLVADVNGVSITLVYDGTTWESYTQAGAVSGEAVTADNTVTLTNKTIDFANNTLTDVASTDTTQTLTNKTIAFDDNTLTDVASIDTNQTLTNKTIDFANNTLTDVASTNTVQTLTNKTLGDFVLYNETVGTINSSNVDLSTGNVFEETISSNTSYTFSNAPASGTAFGFTLKITSSGTNTITWPSSVDWSGGSAPDAPASGETDVFVFFTTNGGSTWYGFQAGDALA